MKRMTLAPSAAPAPPTSRTFVVDKPSWTTIGAAGGGGNATIGAGAGTSGLGSGAGGGTCSDGSWTGGGAGSDCGCANAGDTSSTDMIDARTALANTEP